MSPSSPVSVGMCPSNRTLDAGLLQLTVLLCIVELEQFPVAEDPFTVWKGKAAYRDGRMGTRSSSTGKNSFFATFHRIYRLDPELGKCRQHIAV